MSKLSLGRPLLAIQRTQQNPTFVGFGHSEAGGKDCDEEEIDVEELDVAEVGAEVVADHHRDELGQRIGRHVLEDAERGDQRATT